MRNYKRRKKIILVIFIAILTYICLNFQSKFIIKDNVLLEYKRGILADIMPKKEVEIPYGVTEIGEKAFKNCSELKKVELPEGLEYIGGEVFMCAEKLEEIKFPKSLEIIDAKGYLFDECPNLKKIILPKGFDLDLVYDDTVSIEYYEQ